MANWRFRLVYRRLDADPATQLLNFDPSILPQWATSSPVPSTFIGALIISIVAGYLVKWMNQKIQLPDFLLAFENHIFATDSFRHFCHAGDVLRHHPILGAGSTAVSVLC